MPRHLTELDPTVVFLAAGTTLPGDVPAGTPKGSLIVHEQSDGTAQVLYWSGTEALPTAGAGGGGGGTPTVTVIDYDHNYSTMALEPGRFLVIDSGSQLRVVEVAEDNTVTPGPALQLTGTSINQALVYPDVLVGTNGGNFETLVIAPDGTITVADTIAKVIGTMLTQYGGLWEQRGLSFHNGELYSTFIQQTTPSKNLVFKTTVSPTGDFGSTWTEVTSGPVTPAISRDFYNRGMDLPLDAGGTMLCSLGAGNNKTSLVRMDAPAVELMTYSPAFGTEGTKSYANYLGDNVGGPGLGVRPVLVTRENTASSGQFYVQQWSYDGSGLVLDDEFLVPTSDPAAPGRFLGHSPSVVRLSDGRVAAQVGIYTDSTRDTRVGIAVFFDIFGTPTVAVHEHSGLFDADYYYAEPLTGGGVFVPREGYATEDDYNQGVSARKAVVFRGY